MEICHPDSTGELTALPRPTGWILGWERKGKGKGKGRVKGNRNGKGDRKERKTGVGKGMEMRSGEGKRGFCVVVIYS